jgi:hypothetical protein
MYEVVRYMSHKPEDFKEERQIVFDQHTEPDDRGVVRGGSGKMSCLVGVYLNKNLVRGLAKTPCRKIIEEMRSLFYNHYRHLYAGSNLSDTESGTEDDGDREQDQRVNDAREKLQTSYFFLAIIEKHLRSEWDVIQEKSLLTRARLRQVIPRAIAIRPSARRPWCLAQASLPPGVLDRRTIVCWRNHDIFEYFFMTTLGCYMAWRHGVYCTVR